MSAREPRRTRCHTAGTTLTKVHDPGWRGAWRGVLLVPFLLLPFTRFRRLPRGEAVLPQLRKRFVAYLAQIPIFGVVVFLVAPSPSRGYEPAIPPFAFALGTAGVAALCLTTMMRMSARTSWGGADATPRTLAMKYQSRFFLGMAFAGSVMLMGFLAVFLSYERWLFVLGAGLSLPVYAFAAPTASNVRKAHEDSDTGRDASLLEGLLARGGE